jgi:hypothetical protein
VTGHTRRRRDAKGLGVRQIPEYDLRKGTDGIKDSVVTADDLFEFLCSKVNRYVLVQVSCKD